MASPVIATLRATLTRPIRKRRRLAFAVATTVLAAAALLPTLIRDVGSDGRAQTRPQPAQTSLPSTRPARSATTTEAEQPRKGDDAAARSAARDFVRSYLRYTYGRDDGRALRKFVHPSLWLQLASRPPNVPHDVRTLTPRVSYLRVLPTAAGAASAEALVDDGERRYAIRFVLAATADDWRVVSIGAP